MSKRFETSTPWELQDLCLNGFSNTVACSGCEDFVFKFSVILGKAKDKSVTEDKIRLDIENFRNLGKSSLLLDQVGSKALSNKITKEMSVESIAKAYGYTAATIEGKSKIKANIKRPETKPTLELPPPIQETVEEEVIEEEEVEELTQDEKAEL